MTSRRCPKVLTALFATLPVALPAHSLATSNAPNKAFVAPVKKRSNDCIRTAKALETSHQIPAGTLQAISLVETGVKKNNVYAPWPWTVNIAGKGYYFESKKAALAFAKKKQKAGVKSMDIGCFQINTKWHGDAFRDLDTMFDPSTNGAYAAGFLKKLKAKTSNWQSAISHYHSKTPQKGAAYLAKVNAAQAKMDRAKIQAVPPLRTAVATRARPISRAGAPTQTALNQPLFNQASALIDFERQSPMFGAPRRAFVQQPTE